jgi:hypothetical protein
MEGGRKEDGEGKKERRKEGRMDRGKKQSRFLIRVPGVEQETAFETSLQ